MKTFRHYEYVVSENGEVFRKGNTKPLKPDIGAMGHKRVTLSHLGKTARFLVHRMVAECYIPNPLNLPFINHIDHNPENNSISNLEWCTHAENMLHCHKHGRCSNLKASEKAKEVTKTRILKKFQEMLGVNLIGISVENGSSKILYLCPCCKTLKKSRADSTVFNKKGLCRKCSKDEDIVSSYVKA